ncbi:MAG: hypothetical protein FJX75_16155 [Armatimonadetes bacterium]|nr:hypothetical protein [Armatimonadota bacterium]
MNALALLLAAAGHLTGAQGAPPHLDAADTGISKRIPVAGETITLLVPVLSDQDWRGTVRLRASAARDGGKAVEFASREATVEVGPGKPRDIEVTWQPKETGFYMLTFEVTAPGASPQRGDFGPVAVVARNLYFPWFGTPKEFRWCNVPTTVKEEDAAWWLRRGAIPCAWRGAVCYKEWSLEKFVEHYGSSRCIAIDEIGGPGEDTDKFMAALREVKKQQPDRFTAVWFMGAHPYWVDVTDVVDLFIPEVYLNYRGNHLGTFDSYIEETRAAGVMDRTVCGLGINIVTDEKTKEVRASPTKADVLRQIRHLKRLAPEMPGVGFFTSDSAAEGVAESADELCGEYFVKPVVTIAGSRLDLLPGNPPRATLTVSNCGGMTAHNVVVRPTQRRGDASLVANHPFTIEALEAGASRQIDAPLARVPGISLIAAEIAPSPQYTLLDARAEEPLCIRAAALRDALALVYLPPWDEGERTDVPVSWTLGKTGQQVHVAELDSSGKVLATIPSLAMAESEDEVVRWVAAGPTPSGGRRYFAVLPGDGAPTNAPELTCEETPGLLRIRGPHYVAELDPSADALVSLTPAGSETNLLKTPWTLRCPGHEGFGPPEITRAPGWLAVTVPFTSDLATGRSRYVFSVLAPAIEVSHVVTPKGPLAVKGAGDGCTLEQRGGTYAQQPGVGGVVARGALQDTADYRDLYFGYLGGAPNERNARLAGWLDFSWDAQWKAGLGVAIVERWRDATFSSYDVTRLYDASDWVEVSYVWGTEAKIEREQRSRVFLVPHPCIDMLQTAVPPTRSVWETAHNPLKVLPG